MTSKEKPIGNKSEGILTPCADGDHQWECEGDIGPDSGSETLTCIKCGHTEQIIYY